MRTHRVMGFPAALTLAALCLCTLDSAALGAGPDQQGALALWLPVNQVPAAQVAAEPFIRPERGNLVALAPQAMRQMLATVPLENTARARSAPVVVTLPAPDGTFQRFHAVESPVMEPALAARYPDIKTYSAVGIDDPAATARFDLTPLGFRAQVRTPAGTWYIDPYSRGNDILHTSYYRTDYTRKGAGFTCLTQNPAMNDADVARGRLQLRSQAALISAGTQLRTYRIAICTTTEFTAFYGGTVPNGLAAVVTIINRVTGIYEVDFAARLMLVANNDQLIFTSNPDPFTDPTNPSTTNTQAQTTIDSVIMSANYDTGHTFHRGSDNGLAGGIGTVCQNSIKGQGYSATDPPTGDLFAVDYAAHEIGHNFGGRHPFSNCTGGSGDSAAVAVEPGSASTIMGYAGICGAQNLQPNSDPYFNGINVEQVLLYLQGTGGPCAAVTSLSNTPPTISAGSNYTIPVSTPYVLTATGSDADADPITYCWEQQDGRSGTGLPVVDPGSGPLARSFNPATGNTRTIPRLAKLVTNITATDEVVPATARNLKWRVTARDGRGGINTSDMTITSSTPGGAFSVTAPNTSATLMGATTVTWNAGNSAVAPVNCASVAILLSTDGGFTYPTVLAASTPNDGSESVVLPNITTSTARVRVQAIGNIFFDISNVNFGINPVVAGVAFASGGPATFTDSTGNGNANGAIDPGESGVRVTLPVLNNGQTTATGVTGALTSLTPTVSVVAAAGAYPNLPFGASGANTPAFVIAVSPSHPCASPFTLRLSVNSNEGSGQIDYTLSTGSPGGVSSPQTISYTTPAVAIPDNNTAGATANLTVAGLGASLADINFRFDGSACNTTATSTTVGLNHSWVGDLVVTLTNPAGLNVVIMNRPGGTTNSGHNFCQTTLDDSAGSSIQSITSTGHPYTGTFTPANALAAFQGSNPNGLWKLKVVDAAAQDTGSIRTFSLIIQTNNPPVCTPPLSVTGACCLASGCSILTFNDCNNAGGEYKGDGLDCSPGRCRIACCFPDGSCTELSSQDCGNLPGGTPHLPDVVCTPNPCPQPQGACCASDGGCTLTAAGGCPVGSLFLGPNSACTLNACAGACCAGGVNCALASNAAACAGVFAGPNVACNPPGQHVTPCCQADFNGSSTVTVQDLFDFLAAWFATLPSANFNGVGGVTVQDLFDFLAAWFAKCN